MFLGIPGHVNKKDIIAKIAQFGKIKDSFMSREEKHLVIVYECERGISFGVY